MRSRAGVGMTPPKVPGTPYPWSSVMIRRMLGAPLGGTMRGGHHTFDPSRVSLITPPNGGGGAGSCFGLTVVVALGEPETPLTCWAGAGSATNSAVATVAASMPELGFRMFVLNSMLYLPIN